jgi:superfamily II helicase
VIAERARFRGSRKLERFVGYRLPDAIFSGPVLEALSGKFDFNLFDETFRTQVLNFFHDFLRCGCRDNPLCGCPERKFAVMVIDMRENGLDHRQISAYLLEEYGIDIYPADILSFLEDAVHELEAIRDVSELQGRPDLSTDAAEHIALISR